MSIGKIILLGAIAIFTVVLGLTFSGNASIYTTFDHARETGKRVHIVGEWVQRDQANYDPGKDVFSFYMKDSTNTVEKVRYFDPKPMNFESAEKVVIIGKFHKQEVFEADKIIMKCPSKYEETDLKAGENKGL